MTARLTKRQSILTIALILIIIILVMLFLYKSALKGRLGNDINSGKSFETQILATEGRENIYGSDVAAELKSYPFPDSPQVREHLLAKIAEDSRILQQAETEGKIVLNDSIFNSPAKDYAARITAVNSVKPDSRVPADPNSENSQAGSLKGTVISIWFNNTQPGEAGYEKGKEIAEKEINRLHQAVKFGTITIEDAAEQIRNNETLAGVDPAYKANALFNFDVKSGEKISFDPEFDSALWNLPAGSVSDVFLVKDQANPDAERIDSVYMFAQINEKS